MFGFAAVAHKPQKGVSSLCAWRGAWSKAESERSQPRAFVLYWLSNYVPLGSRWVQKKAGETKKEEDERFLCNAERISLKWQINLNLLQ